MWRWQWGGITVGIRLPVVQVHHTAQFPFFIMAIEVLLVMFNTAYVLAFRHLLSMELSFSSGAFALLSQHFLDLEVLPIQEQKLSIFRTSHVSCCSQVGVYSNRQNVVVASREIKNEYK